MTLRQRLSAARRDDSGAALVIALLFITVVSVAIAAVLAYADANVRVTAALRNQADGTATADAAAQVAINALRNSTYQGPTGDCLGPSGELTLSRFHPTDSAVVTCARDDATSVVGSSGIPSGYALLALQNNSSFEDAVNMKANGPGAGVNVSGDVGSASNINMEQGNLNVTGKVNAKSCAGTINASGGKVCGPTAPTLTDPNYATPSAPTANGTISACAAKRTFTPGLYSNLDTLNNAYSSCSAATVFDFRPGIYYFSFSGVWTINKGTTVGGSTSPLGTTPPTIPGACPNPLTTNSTDGVTFVFGNQAQLLITDTAKVEICGRRPAFGSSDPAIAFYGLKTTLGSGSLRVPAQTGCVIRFSGSGARCAVISTDNHSDTVRFYFQGHVYMPRAKIDLYLLKTSDQYLNGGVTVRAFSLFSPASSTIPTPLSSGPIVTPGPGRTVVLLTVYVCPDSTTCNTGTGKLRLRVKVGFADEGTPVAGARAVTIYNWSVQR